MLVPVGAGLGLRQGEAFGLGVDMIDFLRREVDVCRQVKWLSGRGLMPSDAERGRAVLDAALGERRDRNEAAGR